MTCFTSSRFHVSCSDVSPLPRLRLLLLRCSPPHPSPPHLPKNHPPRRRLQHIRHRKLHLFADMPSPILDHHHRPIFQKPNPLRWILARLHQPHRQLLTRQHHRPKRIGHFIHVDHIHPPHLRHLAQIRIVG